MLKEIIHINKQLWTTTKEQLTTKRINMIHNTNPQLQRPVTETVKSGWRTTREGITGLSVISSNGLLYLPTEFFLSYCFIVHYQVQWRIFSKKAIQLPHSYKFSFHHEEGFSSFTGSQRFRVVVRHSNISITVGK